MTSSDPVNMNVHEDPELFREAVSFTAAQTMFAPRIVEKDYFCSLLMAHLAARAASLVFKGGTCLAKVHADFFRLSEDLDWVVPVPVNATRARRRSLAAVAKEAVAALPGAVQGLRIGRPLTGANRSTQYAASAVLRSIVSGEDEPIKIEVGLREPLLESPVSGHARTLLLDPISGEGMVPVVTVPCISLREAYAEKLRAAMTRREVAIRDYFDVDHALQEGRLGEDDLEAMELLRQKLAVPGNAPVDISPPRLEALRRQVDAQLKAVLRPADFACFDLESAFEAVGRIARSLPAAG